VGRNCAPPLRLTNGEGRAVPATKAAFMRFLPIFLLLSLPCFAAGTRGTIEANVVTPATMTDRGRLSGPPPVQTVVVKNPDGSITIRADF
jgi:hypothetical protein